MKKWWFAVATLVLAAATVAWYVRSRSATPAEKYRTEAAARGDVVMTVTATGTISSVITVQVGSQVSGIIARLHADFNSPVKRGQLLAGVVDLKEFAEKFPTRVNRILDAVGNNELRFKVDAIDEKVVLDGLQKVANRITLGLVVAALIVGAAMLMRVDTSFRIFGYPGLAMILFILAAAAGVVLVGSILFYDEKPKPKKDSG